MTDLTFMSILWCLTALGLFMSVYFLKKTQKSMFSILKRHGLLIDYVAFNLRPELFKIYVKIRDAKFDEKTDFHKLAERIKRDEFERIHKDVSKAIDISTDPVEKARYQEILKEIETIFNLMETVDNSSPEEFIKGVLGDVEKSMEKLEHLKKEM